MTGSNRVGELAVILATTEDKEIDCDQLREVAEKAVEAAAAGEDLRALLPEIAMHLDHCPDCRDYYETLLALVKEPA
jgi:predicted anti-sigma-YlaC factor YlaD